MDTHKNPTLNIDDDAPNFSCVDQDGETITLNNFESRWLVLYFYPKDNTPGCTTEALDFTALKDQFDSKNAAILGISKDSCSSHKKFITKKDLKLNLLSDEDLSLHKAYDVWRLKKFMGREFVGTIRSTFLINPQGKIAAIWDPVKVRGHAQNVLDAIPA